MKCGGMISPFASFTKPESIGCWISACTSVVSPLLVARTRMVDPISLSYLFFAHDLVGKPVPTFSDHARLTAAAADGDFDFLGGAVELAAGFHNRNHVAGLGHLQPVGDSGHRAGGNYIGRRQRVR